MQESQSISSLAEDIDVTDIFFAVSPDYAVVAQKRAPDEQMNLFDQAFNRDYGLTIDDLALLYAKKHSKNKKVKYFIQVEFLLRRDNFCHDHTG